MWDREELAKRALRERFEEAEKNLDIERQACAYLIETGRFKAAELAAQNIVRKQETVEKFRKELR